MTYIVNKDGCLTVNAYYKALSNDLPEMARFGMISTVNKDYSNFTWYGRGPHENYVDRNTDTFMGIKRQNEGLGFLLLSSARNRI